MTPAEKSEIIEILERSKEDFLAAAHGLPEALAKTRPEENRWSILECIEHVATVEGVFLGRIAPGAPGEAPPADKAKEALLAERVFDRSTRRNAPEAVSPKGQLTSLAQGLEQFHNARAKSIQFARDHAANLYSCTAAHPVFGPLNGVEAMIIIANHSRRHAEQIREARAALEKN